MIGFALCDGEKIDGRREEGECVLEMRTIFHATRFVIVTYEYVTSVQASNDDGDSSSPNTYLHQSCSDTLLHTTL